MSSFRFVHAADLHLGSPFTGLARADAEIAARFALATREAFSELVTRTIELGAAFMVIAGDVFDGEWKDAQIGLFFNRELSRLDRAGVRVAIVKGNHDAESVVTRSVPLAENVIQFPAKKAATVRLENLDVAIHGQSFADRAAPGNLASAYPPPVPGSFNIGLMHTSCGGYAAHEAYAPCSVEELRLKGYDYWALGHVHEHEILSRDPWVVFPGCMQGRSVRERGAKGAVVVVVEDGRVLSVERLVVDQARWASIEVDVSGAAEEAEAFRRVEAAIGAEAEGLAGRLLVARVTLTGETPLHLDFAADPRRVAEDVQAALHHVEADAWLEKLKLATRPPGRPDGVAPELKSLDLSALMDGLDADPEIEARARAMIGVVQQRLPAAASDDAALGDDLAAILAEARALALGRLGA